MAWLLFLGILALMAAAYFLGRSVGYDDGYADGYAGGDWDATARHSASGSVRPIPPQR